MTHVSLRSAAATALLAAVTAAGGLVPSWPPTYAMNQSTVFMPCSYAGYFDAAYAAKWGLADFDWSNAKQL